MMYNNQQNNVLADDFLEIFSWSFLFYFQILNIIHSQFLNPNITDLVYTYQHI